MERTNFIAIDAFCSSWNIEISFINSLKDNGLIDVLIVEEIACIEISQLSKLEKLIRFYYELDINLEGIETIMHLLKRMNEMHGEITNLRNQLRLYEQSDT